MKFEHLGGRWSLHIPLVLLLVLSILASTTSAYRVADVVDTDILVDAAQSDALRSQMPMFGVGWAAHVQFEVSESARTFSLQFEDGLWALPATALRKGDEKFLDRITVQFVYSKSGVGAIHSVVVSDAVYSPERRPFFTVVYQWIEEEAVYLSAGQAVMFLAVLLSSIYFLLVSCGVVGEHAVTATSARTSPTLGVPKWD